MADYPPLMSIGAVLDTLRPEFPDISHSKIRFLETEGLVEPIRTPSGYRKYAPDDVQRLQYALRMQRDHYLPLRVIREHLDAMDRGLQPPPVGDSRPRAPHAIPQGLPGPQDLRAPESGVLLSRSEMCAETGLTDKQLREYETAGMVAARPGTQHYDVDALNIATAVAQLAGYGLQPRHLAIWKRAADSEADTIELIVEPLRARKGEQAAAEAEQTALEIAALGLRLKTILVRSALAQRLRP